MRYRIIVFIAVSLSVAVLVHADCLNDSYGRRMCGKGQCKMSQYGKVLCAGGCEQGKTSYCEDAKVSED